MKKINPQQAAIDVAVCIHHISMSVCFGDMCPVKYYILHKLGAVGTGLCNKGPAHLKPAAILGRIAVGFSFNIHKYSCKIMPCQISPQ